MDAYRPTGSPGRNGFAAPSNCDCLYVLAVSAAFDFDVSSDAQVI